MFNTFKPTDPGYAEARSEVDALLDKKVGVDYSAIVEHYNSLPIGSIFTFKFSEKKKPYFVERLSAAGLKANVHYTAVMMDAEGIVPGTIERHLGITKISEVAGQSIGRHGSRGASPAQLAALARGRAARAGASAPAAPPPPPPPPPAPAAPPPPPPPPPPSRDVKGNTPRPPAATKPTKPAPATKTVTKAAPAATSGRPQRKVPPKA